jgi:hypothetical protein
MTSTKTASHLRRPAEPTGEKGFAVGWHKWWGKVSEKNRSFFGRQKFFPRKVF